MKKEIEKILYDFFMNGLCKSKTADKILSLIEKEIDSSVDMIAKEVHNRGNFWNWTPPVGFAQDIINIIKGKIKE